MGAIGARKWGQARREWFKLAGGYDVQELALALEAGARVDWRDPGDRGRTALMSYARLDYAFGVRWLLGRGARCEARDRSGATALGLAASAGSIESMRALLDAGADPLAIDGWGCDVLARVRGSDPKARQMVQLLAPICKKRSGQRALRASAAEGDLEKARILAEAFDFPPSWVLGAGRVALSNGSETVGAWLCSCAMSASEARSIGALAAEAPPRPRGSGGARL